MISREKHLSNIQYHESGLFPPDKDDLAALKDLHIPENLLQVCWNDAKGNKHKHKLFEWEYYKTLSDLIRRGRTLEKAQNAVLESASKMRFNSEDHEIWGLFGTTKRDMAWILGSVFNPPSKNISAAKQNEMF